MPTPITGYIFDSQGKPLGGTLQVTLDAPLTSGQTTYLPTPVSFNVPAATGLISLSLEQTEDTGITYHFTFTLNGETEPAYDFHAIVPRPGNEPVSFNELLPIGISSDLLPLGIRGLGNYLMSNADYVSKLAIGRYAGTYDNIKTYYPGDIVYHDGGSWYLKSTIPQLGETPSELSEYWGQMAERGGTSSGTGGNPTAWDYGTWQGEDDAATRGALAEVLNDLETKKAPLLHPVLEGDARAPIVAPGDNSSKIATTAHVYASLQEFTGTFRNRVLGGDFNRNPWQRGTLFSGIVANTRVADRWMLEKNGGTGETISQVGQPVGQTDVPGSKSFLRWAVKGGTGAGTYSLLSQYVLEVQDFAGKLVTLSFWARLVAGAGSLGVGLYQYMGAGGSPSNDVIVPGAKRYNLTNQWQYYSQTFSVPSLQGKTFGTIAGPRLQVEFWGSAGSNPVLQARSGGTPDGQDFVMNLDQVQLEIGGVATPFEYRPRSVEFDLCQHFFQRLGGQADYYLGHGYQTNGGIFGRIPYRPMRSSPSVIVVGSGLRAHTPFAQNVVPIGSVKRDYLGVAHGVSSSQAAPVIFLLESATDYIDLSCEL